jgi:hypothetical protein
MKTISRRLRLAATLLVVLAASRPFLCSAMAQNMNPQPNFSTQLLSASPSLYLNFNDMGTSFKEQVSGLAFGGSAAVNTVVGQLPSSYTATNTANYTIFSTAPLASGSLNSITVYFYAAPTVGQSIEFLVANRNGSSVTITNTFTVTVSSATAGLQTFSAPANFAAVNVGSGQILGYWTNSSAIAPAYGPATGGYSELYLGATPPAMGTATTFTAYLPGLPAIEGSVTNTYMSGGVTPRQPGFDTAQANNTAASFPYNGFNAAPNNALGVIDWGSSWTMLFHLDRLNWNRTGTLVLASKGDSSSTTNNWWKFYLTMSGSQSRLCFTENGKNVSGAPFTYANQSVCTANLDAMPNGLNYDIVVVNTGTGWNTGLGLYVNGLNGSYFAETSSSGSYQYGFNPVGVTVAGGTGYAATTNFSASGGGPNCVVTGSFASSNGIPTGVVSYTQTSGCTSVPTIVLSSPTGTGAMVAATLYTTSMNAPTLPLMVPGYVSAGAAYGIDGTDNTQTGTLIDEFALFPASLTQAQIQSLFYQTKFYERVLNTQPSTPYTLVFDDDSCDDLDNPTALAVAIAAQRVGYIRLAGVVDSQGDGVSQAVYRQMLDEAGLGHIPLSVPSSFGVASGGGWCSAANVNTFNASTPQTAAAYPQAKTMYRQIFASNPKTPVFIMLGGSFRGVADLMASGADGISPLTGVQLMAQNAANGGAIYAQGLGANLSFSSDNSLEDWTAGQYVVQNNGALPIYWYGGQPQITGPGALSTRTSKDPFYLAAVAVGTDTRQGYDSLPTQSFLSSLFAGGVNVTIGGSGTGYAASTPFTSTGGGPNCVVTGVMLSTSGVPSSVAATSGATGSTLSYSGLGSGCLKAASPPTIVLTNPTGSGAVLSATTTASPCGTVAITGASAGTTTTATCSNHYFLPYSLNAASTPVQGALMEWLLNSLIDPVPGGSPRGR